MSEPDDSVPSEAGALGGASSNGPWREHVAPPRPHRPVLLHVVHDWGGGIERWLCDFIDHDDAHRHLALRSRVGYDGYGRRLELFDTAAPQVPLLRRDLALPIRASVATHDETAALLDEVVRGFEVGGVIVSSLLGHSLDVLATGLPTVFVVHDYYPFCPALTTRFGTVCGECPRERLTTCLSENPDNVVRGAVSADGWLAVREAFARALDAPQVRVVAPSRAALDHLAALFPAMSLRAARVVPNGIDEGFGNATAARGDRARLRVVVPGRLASHKGREELAALLPRIHDFADVLLLGCGEGGEFFRDRAGVSIVPDYAHEALPRLLGEHAPDCALLLSVWPETFSYTLSEMAASGVVPVARRIGAFAERIGDDVDGLLFDDADDLVFSLQGLAAEPERLVRLRAGLARREVPRIGAMVAAYHEVLGPLKRPERAASHLLFELGARLGETAADARRERAQATAIHAQLAEAGQRIERLELEREATRPRDGPNDRGVAPRFARHDLRSMAPDTVGTAVGRDEPQANCDTPAEVRHYRNVTPSDVSAGPLDKARIRARLIGRAALAAWARAGGPLALLRRVGRVWRRGGLRGVRSALRDFALIGSADLPAATTATPPAPAALPATPDARAAEYAPHPCPGPDVASRIRAIAFYLPQFHPIPENDAWWGRGFTEWTNVARGVPQFPGHYQPRLPADLGFYDLRVPEVMREQIRLARRHGLHGFCFHHYWFSGRRLLERPVDAFLADASLDFPFCLCWANESWTRRWDGSEEDVLIAQHYRVEDEARFIDDLLPYLRDARYIRVEGRPVLLVYRVDQLPDPQRAVATWRTACREAGVGDPLLLAVQSFETLDPRDYGFDGAVEFPPHHYHIPFINEAIDGLAPNYAGSIREYRVAVERAEAQPWPDYRWYRGVMPSWDNEARKPGRGAVFHGATPDLYARWLGHVCAQTDARHTTSDDKLVFVNAWNEWAEGAYLEPDRRYGHAFLRATADVLQAFPTRAARCVLVVGHDAHPHGAQMLTLHLLRSLRRDFGCEPHLLLCGPGVLREAYAREAVVHDVAGLGPESRREVIAGLRAQGITEAICNTAVVGLELEQLVAAGMRCVSLIHEMPGVIRAQRLEASVAKIARLAERLVFAADCVRDAFAAVQPVDATKCVVRPQGLYQLNPYVVRREAVRAEVRAELGLDARARIALGLGFADVRKGADLFARAAANEGYDADTVFAWVGHEDPDTLAAIRAEPGCAGAIASGRLRFMGRRAPDEAQRLLAAADVFVLASREDPYPTVVLEAMNAGLPVVAFDGGGGYADLLREGFGELVPMADADALAQAVVRALAVPADKRLHRAEAARECVHRRFGFADYVADLLGLLGERSPGVSVIIPNYNYARHLPERIRSVLAQTRRPREILLLDDASTDDSVAVAERELAVGDVPWRIVRNAANAGCYAQWLRGIALAKNELVWIAEADDACEPTLLETLLPAFDDAQVVLACCQSRQIDEAGCEIAPDYLDYVRDLDPVKWTRPYVNDGPDEIREALVVRNTIPNASAVLMRRPDLSAIQSSLLRLSHAGDWFVYLHLLESGRISYFPAALNSHRRHRESLTLRPDRALRLMREIVEVQQGVISRTGVDDRTRERIDRSNQQVWQVLGLQSRTCRRWNQDARLSSAGFTVGQNKQGEEY